MQILTFELFCEFFVDFLYFFVCFFLYFFCVFFFSKFLILTCLDQCPFFNFQDNSMQHSRKQQNVKEFM